MRTRELLSLQKPTVGHAHKAACHRTNPSTVSLAANQHGHGRFKIHTSAKRRHLLWAWLRLWVGAAKVVHSLEALLRHSIGQASSWGGHVASRCRLLLGQLALVQLLQHGIASEDPCQGRKSTLDNDECTSITRAALQQTASSHTLRMP